MASLLAVVFVWTFGFMLGRSYERRRAHGPLDISKADTLARVRRSKL